MGMNIHISARDKDKSLLSPPYDLTSGSHTVSRFVGSYDFMKVIWNTESDSYTYCSCKDQDNHDYFCDYPTMYRPKNLDKLRIDTIHLQPVFQELIDYLEAEPNAYLEYD